MDLPPFTPLFRNPHAATLAGNFWPRQLDETRFPVTARLFETEPGVNILVHSQAPEGEPKAALVLVHGLEGSSQAGYARSMSQAALEAGFAVHRFNMRSCGGTEAICGKSLYHSGQTGDLLYLVRLLAREGAAPIYLVGFSLGGNVVLKLGGELGESARPPIAGIVAVSAPIDLSVCATAIELPSNFLYNRRFISRLKARVRLKARLTPGSFSVDGLDRIRTVREFDDKVTAPSFGFGTAERYYSTQSSNQFLDRIRVPTLAIHAQDDPVVPFRVCDHPAFRRNSWLKLIPVSHGGHIGFIDKFPPRFWLDRVVIEWVANSVCGTPAAVARS